MMLNKLDPIGYEPLLERKRLFFFFLKQLWKRGLAVSDKADFFAKYATHTHMMHAREEDGWLTENKK